MAARLANGNFTLLAAMAKMMVGHESFICDGRNVDEIYPEAILNFISKLPYFIRKILKIFRQTKAPP
jgi:hypothetical protein